MKWKWFKVLFVVFSFQNEQNSIFKMKRLRINLSRVLCRIQFSEEKYYIAWALRHEVKVKFFGPQRPGYLAKENIYHNLRPFSTTPKYIVAELFLKLLLHFSSGVIWSYFFYWKLLELFRKKELHGLICKKVYAIKYKALKNIYFGKNAFIQKYSFLTCTLNLKHFLSWTASMLPKNWEGPSTCTDDISQSPKRIYYFLQEILYIREILSTKLRL